MSDVSVAILISIFGSFSGLKSWEVRVSRALQLPARVCSLINKAAFQPNFVYGQEVRWKASTCAKDPLVWRVTYSDR